MAKLFSHEGRHRLDRPERAQWQKPDEVVSLLDLKPGMAVADIGAGTGYFAFRIAEGVGPTGKVYGVDLQPEMLEALRGRIAEQGVANIVPVQSGPVDTTLPDAEVDRVFINNVTHEFDDLDASLREHARILKPGGRLVVVDWKPGKTDVGPPPDHRLPPEKMTRAARAAGFSEAGSSDLLPNQYILFFLKPFDIR